MTGTTERRHALAEKQSGSTTIEIARSIDISADQRKVFDYVSDFTRAYEWRTEVVESTMTPQGPMRPGSRLHEVAMVAGREVTTESFIDTHDPLHRFTFEHVSGPLPVSGEYRVEPRPRHTGRAGTTLHYTLRVQLAGAWRLLAPLVKLTAPRTVDRSLRLLATRIAAEDSA